VTVHRLSARTRLTFIYGSLILAGGVLLVVLNYVLVAGIIARQPISIPSGLPTAPQASPGTPAITPGQSGGGDGGADGTPPVSGAAERELKQRLSEASEQLRADFRRQTLPPLMRQSGVLLAGVVAVALWGGWLISGRALRPVRHIATTARRSASRNLRERIDWRGPHDELHELADTFDDLLARLEEAVDDQWRFVANASHELKTPLAINRTLLEVAMGRPDAPPQLEQLGETLLEVNARHERLIDGLLTLARSEQRVAKPVPVDLGDVLHHVRDVVAPEARRAGVRLTVHAVPSPVLGDSALLERLALNVVQNAVRYNTAEGWVEASTAREGSTVRLSVVNSGPDISPQDVPALFEPFRRLHDRVGSAHGTGLGLSIVRSVVRAHGGDVVAAPRPGGGLTVQVTLPARG
jgi:signal transduction histidine kinase